MAEEYYQIPENPKYSVDDIRKLLNSDPGNAETVFNPLILRILENIAAVHNDRAADAGSVTYDPAASQLEARDVQAAIDALKEIADAAGTDIAGALATAQNAASAAGTARQAADTAKQAADAAAQTAQQALGTAEGGLKIAAGKYTGNGETPKTIEVGFKPVFVAITIQGIASNSGYDTTLRERYRYSNVTDHYNFYGKNAVIYAGQSKDLVYTSYESGAGNPSYEFYSRTYSVSDTGITLNVANSATTAEYVANVASRTYYWVAIGR